MATKNSSLLWKILIPLVLLIVLALVLKRTGVIGDGDAVEVELDTVQVRTIIETVMASGKLQPATEVKISADVSGEIIELPVIEGQQVEKGQLLVRINPDIYQSNVERTRASVNNALANLASARAQLAQQEAQFRNRELTYNRNKKLIEQNAISQSEFETAEADYEISKAQLQAAKEAVSAAGYMVKNAEAGMREAQDNLKRTTIYAPVSGTVTLLAVESGERVVGTTQMQGTEMMRVSQLGAMEVKVDVNENDIIRVQKGDTAIIEVDAFPDEQFTGVVSEIANSAQTEGMSLDQVTNFEVKILVLARSYAHLVDTQHSENSPFMPGMSAVVDIQTAKKENILTVPIMAVTTYIPDEMTKDDGESEEKGQDKKVAMRQNRQEIVYRFEDGEAKRQMIKTGVQDDEFIEVIEGLADKDVIIAGPYATVTRILKDGQKVEIEKEGNSR
ncbi:MAG: efflux RND transporter periplasmic adaptor subunit [Bacteroidia bacterium]